MTPCDGSRGVYVKARNEGFFLVSMASRVRSGDGQRERTLLGLCFGWEWAGWKPRVCPRVIHGQDGTVGVPRKGAVSCTTLGEY